MPFTSGTYSLPSGNPVVTGTTISSSTTNTTNSDIATALSSCILKDGTQTVTANIPMASHKITGLSAGTTAGDSVEYGGSPKFAAVSVAGSTSGTVTLQAPAVAGSTVLTLPAQTGTVMVNGPAFSYYQSVAQTLTSTTLTKITFTTSEFDTTGGMYASSRFTPTVAGYYQVSAGLAMGSSVTGVQLIVYKNGASYKLLFNIISITVTNGATGSALVYLNGSTDYIEIYGQFATGQNTAAIATATYFQAAMIRSA